MKVLWAVICEGSATDQETNNISLFTIVEEMHIPEPPGDEPPGDESAGDESAGDGSPLFPARLLLVALFSRSDFDIEEKGEARLVIHLANGQSVVTQPHLEVDLESAHRSRIKFNLPGIPVGGQGQYKFELQALSDESDWDPIFEVPIHVSFLT